MNCPQCGTPLEPDSLFCSECGYHLSDAEAAQAMQAAQAAPSLWPTPSTYPASAAQASPIPQPVQQSGIPTQPLPVMPGLGSSLSKGLSNSADANASAAGAAGNPPPYASYATSSGVRPPASAAPGIATTTATATGLTRGQKIIVVLGGMLAVLLIVLCVMLWMSMSGSSGAPAAGSSTTSQSSESGASDNANGSSKDSNDTSDGDASNGSSSSSSTSKNSGTSDDQSDDSDKADSQYGSASEPPSSTLKSYSKNGFTVSVPDNFKEYGTSTNESPGYTFTGSGMEITAWRVANNGVSSADELARLRTSAEVDVAYELDADPSVYVSYERDGDIYYIREIVSDEGIIGVQLRYPKAHRSMYDSLTETIPPTLTFTE